MTREVKIVHVKKTMLYTGFCLIIAYNEDVKHKLFKGEAA